MGVVDTTDPILVEARDLAYRNQMLLIRHSPEQYRLSSLTKPKWIISVDTKARTIWRDRESLANTPRLEFVGSFTILDVVTLVIKKKRAGRWI